MEERESLSPQHCSLQNSTGFCEIELMQPVQPANIMMTVELSFPNKVKARIEANEQQFALLLREMLHATSTGVTGIPLPHQAAIAQSIAAMTLA